MNKSPQNILKCLKTNWTTNHKQNDIVAKFHQKCIKQNPMSKAFQMKDNKNNNNNNTDIKTVKRHRIQFETWWNLS